jgi:hypothetical protein
MSKKKVKTSTARLMIFEYQDSSSILTATGASNEKIMQRAALCVQREQTPGFALYDAIEREKIGGKELLALATIGLVSILKTPAMTIDMDNFDEEEKIILKMMPQEFFDKLLPDVAEKLRKLLDE